MNASIVTKQNLDPETIAELETLRSLRLTLAQQQLLKLDETAEQLTVRGANYDSLVTDANFINDLRSELVHKVETLQERMKYVDVFFSDEVDMYLQIAENF